MTASKLNNNGRRAHGKGILFQVVQEVNAPLPDTMTT